MEITLRLPILSDAETILSWENNRENWHVSDNDSPYSLEDIIELILSFQTSEKPEQIRFIIHSEELLLGAVDLFDINYENKSGAIGILIAEQEFRRKGAATMALDLIENEALKLGIERLTASIHSENVQSCALFGKMGYLIVSNEKMKDAQIISIEKWVKKES